MKTIGRAGIPVLLFASAAFFSVSIAAGGESSPAKTKKQKDAPDAATVAAAAATIVKLDDDDPDVRTAASKRLKQLDPAVLTWLEDYLKKNEAKLDAETKSRLLQVIAFMRERRQGLVLERGSQAVLNLEKAGPEAAFRELSKQTGNRPPKKVDERLSGEKKTLHFSGSYWNVFDELLKAYPPHRTKKTGPARPEDLLAPRRFDRWTRFDYASAGWPHVNTGACRLRLALLAKERRGKRVYLSFVLVPVLEPRFCYEDLSIKVESVGFDGKRETPPLKAERKWSRRLPANQGEVFVNKIRGAQMLMQVGGIGMGGGGPVMSREALEEQQGPTAVAPGRRFRWYVPLVPENRSFAKVSLRGTVTVAVMKKKVVVLDLSQENKPLALPNGVTLTVKKKNDRQVAVTVTGTGDYNEAMTTFKRLLDPKETITVLNAAGNKLTAYNRGSSSSVGPNSWKRSRTFGVNGTPVKVRLSLPDKKIKAVLPFEFKEVPAP